MVVLRIGLIDLSRPNKNKTKTKTHIEQQGPLGAGVFSLLAALSGSCGLAYEIIYVRLFSNYFGDSFVMSGIILSAVFLGIAFGAWQSTRFIRALAIIEITIGLYAFMAVTAFSYWGFELASFGSSTLFNALKLVFLLGLPAFLIGTCVPLFTRYAQTNKTTGSVFTRIYAFYNMGAFLSVLAIEFILFRQLGIFFTGVIIGCINLAIGATLLITHASKCVPSEPTIKTQMNTRIISALFVASFASGIFQLFVLRLSFSIFGPLHENFAIILTSAILGVAIGSWLSLSKRLSFDKALLCLSIGVLIFLSVASLFIEFWSSATGSDLSDRGELFVKIALLGGYPLVIFILFGAMVPLAIKAHDRETAPLSGRLLAISSFGNGLGTLFMFIVLYQYFSLLMIGGMISALLFFGFLILSYQNSIRVIQAAGWGIIVTSFALASVYMWPRVELLFGYRTLANSEQLIYRRTAFKDAVVYKAYDQSVSLVSFNDQNTSLVINGYGSLTFGPQSKSVLHEAIVGATPGLFSKNNDEALVFGLGTGITGGATAQLYKHTKIVEVNPAMFNIPQHFIQANKAVMHNADVDVVLEDGISTLLNDSKTYDAVINTVTSPQYYAAAKLYTQDFYEIVKTRLNEGGVYSSWFDLRIDRAGISIMLNTLEASFKSCRYFVLGRAYFNVVCGDAPLIYRSSKLVSERISGAELDTLVHSYEFPNGFAATMIALEIKFREDFLIRNSTDINTLDLPAIEFVVARNNDIIETSDLLAQAILANIESQRKTSFGTPKWKENCKAISHMSGLQFKGC